MIFRAETFWLLVKNLRKFGSFLEKGRKNFESGSAVLGLMWSLHPTGRDIPVHEEESFLSPSHVSWAIFMNILQRLE